MQEEGTRQILKLSDHIYHIPEIRGRKNKSDNGTDEYYNNGDPDDSNDEITLNPGHDEDTRNPTDIKLNYQMQALESLQYQAGLAVTGAWKGSNTLKIYDELGWESLHHRRYFRRITQIFKIMNGQTPQYLVDPVPVPRRHLFGRHPTNDLYEFIQLSDPKISKLFLPRLSHLLE